LLRPPISSNPISDGLYEGSACYILNLLSHFEFLAAAARAGAGTGGAVEAA